MPRWSHFNEDGGGSGIWVLGYVSTINDIYFITTSAYPDDTLKEDYWPNHGCEYYSNNQWDQEGYIRRVAIKKNCNCGCGDDSATHWMFCNRWEK